MRKPRILIADDHRLLTEAFEKLLESQCEIVGPVADGRALLDAARELEPDIILLDISMPLLNGLEAGRRIRKLLPDVKLIYLTVNEDPEVAAEAFRLGASGYLLKNSAANELFQAVNEVARGRSYLTPLVARGTIEAMKRATPRKAEDRLTPRQREVLQLLAEGHSMKEAGTILGVTARTVAHHKYTMMRGLEIGTTAELVQFAVKHGIVSA